MADHVAAETVPRDHGAFRSLVIYVRHRLDISVRDLLSASRIERPGYPLWIFGGAVARFDESVYVKVRLSGGGGWVATLYAPEGLRAILDGWRRVDGEHFGLYLWAPGVILIRELAFVPLGHDRHAP